MALRLRGLAWNEPAPEYGGSLTCNGVLMASYTTGLHYSGRIYMRFGETSETVERFNSLDKVKAWCESEVSRRALEFHDKFFTTD